MIPVDQTKFPVRGNCVRACIASILEIDIDSIPAWEDQTINWHLHAKGWLRERGYGLSCVVPGVCSQDDTYGIAIGDTTRSVLYQHACVCLNGKIVHDPYPSKAGLTSITRIWEIWKV